MRPLLKKIVRRIVRIITSYLKFIFIKPIIFFPNQMRENRSKTTLKKHNIDLYLTTESIFRQLRKRQFKFRGWSLAKSAIRYTIDELFQQKKEKINIVELGGGVSTFFWHYLKKEYDKLEMNVTTFEHDKDWSDFLVTEIGASVTILNCKLKQLSENERLTLFEKPEGAIANWQLISNFPPNFNSLFICSG